MLDTDGGTTAFTSGQISDLEDIADQCRLEGGYAVVLARIALDNTTDYSSIDEVCGVDERSNNRKPVSVSNEVLVTNPTHDKIALMWEQPVTEATISLWSTTGSKVNEWNITDKKYFTTGIAVIPGIYILQIQENGQTPQTHKLIVH